MATRTAEDWVAYWNQRSNDWASFELLCNEEPCIKAAVIKTYKAGYPADGNEETVNSVSSVSTALSAAGVLIKNTKLDNRKSVLKNFNPDEANNVRAAGNWVWRTKGKDWITENIFKTCAAAKVAGKASDNANTSKDSEVVFNPNDVITRPFDRRLDRLEESYRDSKQKLTRYVPFSSDFAELSTTGYLISQDSVRASEKATGGKEGETALTKKVQTEYDKMANDEFYKGVPSLQNYYALVRLFGSDGGKYLVNQKNQRRWYELDATSVSNYNFASTPTTSALISWGQGDPYGRTPYQFTDFVFAKYWNKIENNRLVTLRRYAAPILDNLKFPGMISETSPQNSDTAAGNTEGDNKPDPGSSKSEAIAFPPMASAITYFGGDTGNTLNNILKFTTGVLWEDTQAAVWEVNTDSVPSNESGAGSIFGSVAKFAEMLNVAGGKFDREIVQNAGQMPPDPYKDGPYENRIMGPINRIDSVKRRKAGLAFEWDGINLQFEYVARPVGGVNPKAVLLDIMSNFLVIGSASAVFFGGAHRFMANPAKYPFLGGQEGIEKWYKGDPIGWGLTTIKQFSEGGAEKKGGGSANSAATGLFKNMEGFFNQLFSGEKGSMFGAVSNLFTGSTGNLINNEIAKKTAGQIPYLHNMKAILTGEPIGEWHVTVGNPLNPIAMIGNLICEGVTVEWNEELGPDDFPTEIKFTVKLKHAMARDRDAIESIFNRGMGRIYNLPDSFAGSADYQTSVDNATKTPSKVGYAPDSRMGILLNEETQTGRTVSKKELNGKPLSMGGETSVWARASFNLGISENSATQFITSQNDIFKSAFRTADWIAKKSLT